MWRCVMIQPVRRNTDAGDATHTNQFRRDVIILWKSFDLSSNDAALVVANRICAGVFEASAVKRSTGMAVLRRHAQRACRQTRARGSTVS